MQLKPGSHIHMMGICGTAMGGLAGLLKAMGYKVTGSDQNVYPPMSTQLEKLGIKIKEGYKRENLTPRPDFVIVGNVMTRKHDEVQALLETDIPYTSLPDALGRFVIEDRKSIVIAGTHGKTTTTAMAAWVAKECGKDPGFLIGGKPQNFDTSFELPRGDYFVIEGDEYDTAFFAKVPKFLFYRPRYVILTSVEFDHADIYKDLDDVKKAFNGLMDIVPEDGIIVSFADDANTPSVVKHAKAKKVLTYGIENGEYQARNIRFTEQYCEFEVVRHGQTEDTVQISIFGRHNVANALAVYVLTKNLGWPVDKIKTGLRTFKGVKRRQEILGKPNGITVIEDFAHHPTAVKVTIESIHERFKDRRLFAIFEPRSATSRRKVFQKDYVNAFSGPWDVLLAQPFNQAALAETDRFSSEELVSDLHKGGTRAKLLPNVQEIVDFVGREAKPGDVVLIMSNGGFDGIYGKMLDRLGQAARS
ncbi:MAG TPA: UDP-N-acetylmuramate:L-alanyl-gamma-D-glutamyl-meso-diaminopimelate ligase [Bdellovibrionales bacterium]|nr:UDP-N-acetylmuramate:L-alanyl-gamma-D-glutamyl-meso-diaminopimelate ligase [Bdellovibrionales bacterium]